jgi:CheY-like chemotaxis protein
MARILLVDDDQDLIEMNQMVLTRRGHKVTAAYSAAEAWVAAQADPPDAAVLDVMMEDKTAGYKLARQLHERFPSLPMIMLTGIRKEMHVPYPFEPDETWLPITKLLEKPLNPRALADEVERLLAGKK